MPKLSKRIKEPGTDKGLRYAAYLLSAIWIFALFLPFYWLLSSSIKDQASIYRKPIQWIPTAPKAYTIDIRYKPEEWASQGEAMFRQDAAVISWMAFDHLKKIQLAKVNIEAYVDENKVASSSLSLRAYKKQREALWPILVLNEKQALRKADQAAEYLSFHFAAKPDSPTQDAADDVSGQVREMIADKLPQLNGSPESVSHQSSLLNLLDNYIAAWEYKFSDKRASFGLVIANSLTIAFVGIALQWIFSSLAAYTLSRMLKRGVANVLSLFFLGTLMIPGVVTLIPLYLMMDRLGFLNTLWAVIIPAIPNAFNIYLFKGFFDELPHELFDAARIDGASELRVLTRLVVPLSKPVFGVIALFAFLGAWNELFWPYLVLQSQDKWTIPILISGLLNNSSSGGKVDYPAALAMSVISAVPMLIIFAFFQKYLSRGLVWSGLKG